jgi:ABC-type iron transport system FetAB permease component
MSAMMDRAVARLLRVQPRPPGPREAVATTSSRPLETPLLVSAVRCTLRYVVLPFVLPLLGVGGSGAFGIATGAALGVLLTLDVIAAIAIVATLRRLWRLRHPRRWQYLALALALAVLVGVFFVSDTRVLFI